MNKYKLYMHILLIYIFSNSFVSADMVNGKSLLKSIESSDHENVDSIAKFFDGYVSGVADSTVNVDWCPENKFKRSQLLRILIRYYKSNPVDSDNVTATAKDLVLDALKDAYPCK